MYDCNIRDLRAIMEGYDIELVEAVGGTILLDEEAHIQEFKIMHGENMKAAKNAIKEARRKAKDGDKSGAKAEYDAAIRYLKKVKEECEEIDDEHLLITTLDSFVRSMVPAVAGTIGSIFLPQPFGSIAYLTSIVGIYVCGMSKYLDWLAAIENRDVTPNRNGAGGKYNPSTWWVNSQTRGAAMTKLNRLIDVCEKAKKDINIK